MSFIEVMEENSEIYGESLMDAKKEFAGIYENHFLTEAKESFDRVVRQGTKEGIDWSAIRLTRIEVAETSRPKFEQLPVTIVFTSRGKSYRIILDKALIMQARWRASQHIKLM